MHRKTVLERSTPLAIRLPRIIKDYEHIDFCISIPKSFVYDQRYFAIEVLPAEMIDDENSYKVASEDLSLMGFLMSSLFPIWVRGLSNRKKFGRVSATKHYNTFPFPAINQKQAKEITERVNTVNKARSTLGGKSLSDIYIDRELEDHLEMAHEDLDETLLKIFGLPSNATNEEIFEKLFGEYCRMADARSS